MFCEQQCVWFSSLPLCNSHVSLNTTSDGCVMLTCDVFICLMMVVTDSYVLDFMKQRSIRRRILSVSEVSVFCKR